MPTNRKRKARTALSKVPTWWLRFIETGERLPDDHPDADQFFAAWLLAGWAKHQGWPECPR